MRYRPVPRADAAWVMDGKPLFGLADGPKIFNGIMLVSIKIASEPNL
jgi:hypothetical protein